MPSRPSEVVKKSVELSTAIWSLSSSSSRPSIPPRLPASPDAASTSAAPLPRPRLLGDSSRPPNFDELLLRRRLLPLSWLGTYLAVMKKESPPLSRWLPYLSRATRMHPPVWQALRVMAGRAGSAGAGEPVFASVSGRCCGGLRLDSRKSGCSVEAAAKVLPRGRTITRTGQF